MHLGEHLANQSARSLSRLCQQECRARCCRGAYLVPMHGGEPEAARMEALAASRGLTLRIVRDKGQIYWRQDQQEGGQCPFLDAKCRCTVYEDRPAACREYPHAYSPGCRLSGWNPAHTVFVATVHGKSMPYEFLTMRDQVLDVLSRFAMLGGTSSATGVRVDDNRNKMVEAFLKSDAEYLLFLDDDMGFPPNVGVLLARHQVDVCCGLYFQRVFPEAVYPHWYRYERYGQSEYGQEGDLFTSLDEAVYHATQHLPNTGMAIADTGSKLVPIDAGGTGCTLIRRRVLEAMPAPWFRTEGATNGDLYFFKKAKDLGFEIFGDPGVVCSHFTQAAVGLDAFRISLKRRMEPNITAAAGVRSTANVNTPQYWDYVWGVETLHGERRNYGASDYVFGQLLTELGAEHPKVADFGCGRSSTYANLQAVAPGLRYVGVDYSEVAQAENRKDFPEATWLVGDVRETAIGADQIDLAVASHVIEHLEEPDQLVREMWRTVRPGGYLALAFPLGTLEGTPAGEHVQEFDWDQMIALLSLYGAPVWCIPADRQRPVAVVQKPAAA